MVKAIPDGEHTVTMYLHVRGAADALAFYEKAFGAREKFRLTMGDQIGHAEFVIGDTAIMVSDENPAWGNSSPTTLGGRSSGMNIYVPDCDAAYAKALAAGATSLMPPADQFYGHRSAAVIDPFGHKWSLSTQIEEMTPAEMQARMNAWIQSQAK